uniref:NADH-ubiquinone oxidoreductase chain 5 n=1 Tax=Leptomyrmex pallens TaxID=611136 RepID=V5JEZ3_9HYME|nr:NADH dehydrogenase subunit 5 [Leptomyrmex pallens]AGL61398.1 NADH dehydrogenase subunit 5 [Leptomyrmex pallens]
MVNFLVYFVFMFISFMIMFMVSCWLYYWKASVLMEWGMFGAMGISMDIFILLDWVSALFVSLVCLITSMIYLYSSAYMKGDPKVNGFIVLVFMFVLSMVLMIIMPSVFSILFGWDGLGLVSYCLIIYYQNYSSYSAGMVTVLFNRVGDVALLVSIGLMFSYGSWAIYMLSSKVVMYMLVLAAMTKSAQVPFSSWLPLAMAAPTPVSALVHSSTLVTAGVYLLIRYEGLLAEAGMSSFVLVISTFTGLMSGMMASFEFDLKKIIALSTLSQLSVMFVSLGLGLSLLSFFHLMVHAVFKSLLFMSAGSLIHSLHGSQDIRGFGSLAKFMPFTMVGFYVSIISLCGFPFMSGFYSKDLIMEFVMISPMGWGLVGVLVISLMFTVLYSVRIMSYSFLGGAKMSVFSQIGENSGMGKSMLVLVFLSIIIGGALNWFFFFDFYMPFMSVWLKMVSLLMCVIAALGAVILDKIFMEFGMFYLGFFSSMWFLSFLNNVLSKGALNLGDHFSVLDKTWVEYFGGSFFSHIWVTCLSFILENLKIYMFMGLVVSSLMVIFF